ncbi:MAG TPA: hypothetical protein VGF30_08660 [Bacteroidia bacterium]
MSDTKASGTTRKTTANIINGICILFSVLYLYKLIRYFGALWDMVKSLLDFNFYSGIFLFGMVYTPLMILFFYKRFIAGWILMLIWTLYSIYQDCMDFITIYVYYDIDDPFMGLIPKPTLPVTILLLLFHIAITYFLLRKNTRQVFFKRQNH